MISRVYSIYDEHYHFQFTLGLQALLLLAKAALWPWEKRHWAIPTRWMSLYCALNSLKILVKIIWLLAKKEFVDNGYIYVSFYTIN